MHLTFLNFENCSGIVWIARDGEAGMFVGAHTPRQEVYLSCMPPAPPLTRPFAYKESNRAEQLNMQLPPTGYCHRSAVPPYHHSIQTGCG